MKKIITDTRSDIVSLTVLPRHCTALSPSLCATRTSLRQGKSLHRRPRMGKSPWVTVAPGWMVHSWCAFWNSIWIAEMRKQLRPTLLLVRRGSSMYSGSNQKRVAGGWLSAGHSGGVAPPPCSCRHRWAATVDVVRRGRCSGQSKPCPRAPTPAVKELVAAWAPSRAPRAEGNVRCSSPWLGELGSRGGHQSPASAVRGQSEGNQRSIRGQSEGNQRAIQGAAF